MKTRLKIFLAFTFLFGVLFQASATAATVDGPQTILNNQNDNKDGVEDGNAGAPQRPHDKRRHGHAE